MKNSCVRAVVFALAMLSFVAVSAGPASAQGFISPLIGYDFGGDSGCPQATGCEDKNLNWGVGVGTLGSAIGFEEEFAYARDFFGKTPTRSSSVLTVMSNLMIAPAIGPVHPFLIGGVGLMKTHVDFTTSSLLSTKENGAAWDAGAGLLVLAGGHVGLRGDVRHFRSFKDFDVLGVPIQNTKLRYNRASIALFLRF